MTNPDLERLPSAHLEDMAYIVLSARTDRPTFELYPDLSPEIRTRLRSRLKQLGRYDWPSSLRLDPAIRRGLTLRQCCRLSAALLLLDAHLPPSLAVVMAQNNEVGFLRAMSAGFDCAFASGATPDGILAIVLPAEIQESIGFPHRSDSEEERVRFLRRKDLGALWSDDCAGSGARLAIDVTTVASALWRWISERRLMTDGARKQLHGEIEGMKQEDPFKRVADRIIRR